MMRFLKALFTGGEEADIPWDDTSNIYNSMRVRCSCLTEEIDVMPECEDLLWLGFYYRGPYYPKGFWGRLAGAVKLLRGERFLHDDVMLNRARAVELAEFILAWSKGGTGKDYREILEKEVAQKQKA